MAHPDDSDERRDPELAALLARLPAPEPPPELFERALARARREAPEVARARSRRRWRSAGLAAGLAAVAVAGLALYEVNDAPGVPVVSVSLHEPETVRLVFAADDALEDATMTVTLPRGVELEGFPGEREIRWDTSLAPGANLLPLTLIATAGAGGEMRARLEHASRNRTFRVRIDVG